MRVLLLALDVDLSRNRGDSIHARNLAKSLSHAGHEVTLVAGAAYSTVVDGVRLSVLSDANTPRALWEVLHVAQDCRPEVIYERRFSPKVSAALARLLGIPYVVEINGIPEEEAAMQDRPLPTGTVASLKKRARVSLLRQASAIVTVTEGLRSSLVSEYRIPHEKVHVIPNGVDSSIFRPRDQAAARRSLGLGVGPLVCFIGNFVRWHGLGTLIEALRDSQVRFRIMAIGEGPERTELEAAADRAGVLDRVVFTGEVPHSQVPDFIAASNLCVAPATAERNLRIGSSALKLYEYLACGRPLVASAIPGITELIDEYRCGIAVPPGDSDALGAAIVEVLSNPTFQEAALRASDGVRQRFSWDRTASQVTKVLDRLVANPRLVTDGGIRA